MSTTSGIVVFFIPALLTMILFVFMRAALDFVIGTAEALWRFFN